MERMKAFVESSRKSKKLPKITIITGAGNHSGEKGALIKPQTHAYLKEQNLVFQEVNNGSVSVDL
jgi:hypothetical protein